MNVKGKYKLLGNHPNLRYVTKSLNYNDIFGTISELKQFNYIIEIYNDKGNLIYHYDPDYGVRISPINFEHHK